MKMLYLSPLTNNLFKEEDMAQIIKVEYEGVELWVEADGRVEGVAGKPQQVSVSDALKKLVIPLDKITDTIKAYCKILVKSFKSIEKESTPNRIKAEFGLKTSLDGNIYVVKSSSEASIKITAEWDLDGK
ncbi:MAG: hypothetical protein HQK96_17510 [Nitrospirae bacterium]|nr:hypothetical protein [Nitrospirota bacterium]